MSLREQLIGAWQLVSYIERPVDGSPARQPMSERPQGLILYTPDGYMSAQISAPDRKPFASGDWFRAEPDEFRTEASTYIAYSGPFDIGEEPGTLIHGMQVSLFPNWCGQRQIRRVTMEGDRLMLSSTAPVLSGGALIDAELLWQRAPAFAAGKYRSPAMR